MSGRNSRKVQSEYASIAADRDLADILMDVYSPSAEQTNFRKKPLPKTRIGIYRYYGRWMRKFELRESRNWGRFKEIPVDLLNTW